MRYEKDKLRVFQREGYLVVQAPSGKEVMTIDVWALERAPLFCFKLVEAALKQHAEELVKSPPMPRFVEPETEG
jgi:hypothetical protein